eukprot:UN03755
MYLFVVIIVMLVVLYSMVKIYNIVVLHEVLVRVTHVNSKSKIIDMLVGNVEKWLQKITM